jgi:hypothetical protein
MSANTERHLALRLACGCTAGLGRRYADEKFVLVRFERQPECSVHAAPPAEGTLAKGFGPYPDWASNVAMRVNSLPEAGGMMEREHAFVLDEQFVFFEDRPLGPIRDASWVDTTAPHPSINNKTTQA